MGNVINKIKAIVNNMAPSKYTVHLHQEIEGDLMKVVLVEERRGKKRVLRDVCGNGITGNIKQEIFLLASFDNRNEAMEYCDTIGRWFTGYCSHVGCSLGAAKAVLQFQR